ncbi:MAG: TIGR02147 family protein [Bdellovibrionota bacterium]|nr:TIGR02147 family protein [Bdellovibrionota bacterium]
MNPEENKNTINSKVFLQVLRRELLTRKESNPSYSLRAFAKSLKIDPGLLSKIINQKRQPTQNLMKSCLDKLRMDLEENLKLYQSNASLDEKHKSLNSSDLIPISKWYFFAILDLFHLPDFENNIDWMSKRIGIDRKTTEIALDLLVQSKHLEKVNANYQLRTDSSNWVNFNNTTETKKSLQKQILQKAIQSIDDIDFKHRESSSLSLPINTAMIPEMKTLMDEFKQKVIELSDKYDEISPPNEVYQLSMQFFPLTRINENLKPTKTKEMEKENEV